MRLLALIEQPNHVCYRYRVQAYETWLAEAGWQIDAQPIPHGPIAWRRVLRQAAEADAVLITRKLLSPWWLWLLRQASRRLIYDLDDAMFYRDSNSSKAPYSLTRLRRFRATVRAADAVMAGNHFLAAQAAAFAPSERIEMVPTCVDPACYPRARHDRRGEAVRLAWIGSRSTMPSLDEAHGGLAAAAARLGSLELHVVCDAAPKLAGVQVTLHPWSQASEAADLAAADVGISWLPDHPWSRGKCGLKVLQYMAAGLPVVANPIGVHRELIQHGRTGFLAETPAEWADAIAELAADPRRRGELGRNAREFVERHYSIAQWGPRFAAIVAGENPATSAALEKAASRHFYVDPRTTCPERYKSSPSNRQSLRSSRSA
ncbi:MAG TPA: glycosyltransferase family 4 protein [Pirellulales bacterium]|nr:glycosyltransferase family 4 protein [Pirellulales bacterium]